MDTITFGLSGRIALVTGASSGIGRSLCLALARTGASVAACARRKDRLDDLIGEITASDGRAMAVQMDVADEQSVADGYDAIEKELGTPDTIYANAGISLPGGPLDLSSKDFDSVLSVNLRGVFLVAAEGARRMVSHTDVRATGRGRIIVVASIGSYKAMPGHIAYSTSKGGALMLGKSMARDLAHDGINVNVVCPGSIATDINTAFYESEMGKAKLNSQLRPRLMEKSDIEPLLLLLGSDAARAITGSAFVADDGQTL